MSILLCTFQHKVGKHHPYTFQIPQNENYAAAFQVNCVLSGGITFLL